jgi:hypothetical protein
MGVKLSVSVNYPFAQESEVKPGDRLICDGGFTCVPAGKRVKVMEAPNGLYFKCKEGRHYLDGQLGDNGELIGLVLYKPHTKKRERITET